MNKEEEDQKLHSRRYGNMGGQEGSASGRMLRSMSPCAGHKRTSGDSFVLGGGYSPVVQLLQECV